MTEGAGARLARYAAQSRPESVPARVIHEAKRSILNWLGCALGGCRDPAIERAISALLPLAGPPQASVLGRSERVGVLDAAHWNAMSANLFDFDDTHLRTVIHPTAPVAPALVAFAQWRRTTGAELLHAFAVGVEVECRIGNAVSPWHYAHGWHITSTCGVIGAAAAIGCLMKLDPQRMHSALGTAATQACGLVENLGFLAKSINVGNAPRNGIVAALVAEQGGDAAPGALDGIRGFLRVMGRDPDVAALTDGLGETWELALNTYKAYPGGIVLHPVVDACLALRNDHGVRAGDVERIVVRGNPLLFQRTDRGQVTTGREAQVSLHHTVGAALVHGRAGLAQYTDACVAEPAVRELGGRVVCEPDEQVPVESVHLRATVKGTGVVDVHVPHARGSLARPLSDAEIETKFRELAAFGAPACDASRLIDAIWSLDTAADAASFVPYAVIR